MIIMSDALKPLAEKLRPKNFDEIIGHDSILSKTIDNSSLKKFQIKTSSDLHKYTKATFLNRARPGPGPAWAGPRLDICSSLQSL